MNDRLSILFYPKGDSLNKNGKTSIYLRITVNGKRCEISIKRKIDSTRWNSISGTLNGNSEEAYQLNRY
ncbi:Arm DNA-binding domain-containing protein, partial [Algibacter sp.]|nr:Arm DNA-binding domain-containing protein [Algibacter sp.]